MRPPARRCSRGSKGFGAVSILVNNAGITRDNCHADEGRRMGCGDRTNLKSVFRMSRLVMRGMMKARRTDHQYHVGGGELGNPGQANYAAAKAGVAGMTRALAQELGSRNITVNSSPGFIDTDMTKALSDASRESPGRTDCARAPRPAGGDRCRGCLPRLARRPATLLETRCT